MDYVNNVLFTEKAIAALVTGLFGFIPIMIKWYSDRSIEKSKQYYLTKLSNELEFLKQWNSLYRNGSENSETKLSESQVLQPDLNRILENYRDLKNKEIAEPVIETEIPLMRRVFLLFLPTTWKSWIYHTFFYILLFFTAGFVLIGIFEPRWEYFAVLVVVFGTPLFLFQRAAARIRQQTINLVNESGANTTMG